MNSFTDVDYKSERAMATRKDSYIRHGLSELVLAGANGLLLIVYCSSMIADRAMISRGIVPWTHNYPSTPEIWQEGAYKDYNRDTIIGNKEAFISHILDKSGCSDNSFDMAPAFPALADQARLHWPTLADASDSCHCMREWVDDIRTMPNNTGVPEDDRQANNKYSGCNLVRKGITYKTVNNKFWVSNTFHLVAMWNVIMCCAHVNYLTGLEYWTKAFLHVLILGFGIGVTVLGDLHLPTESRWTGFAWLIVGALAVHMMQVFQAFKTPFLQITKGMLPSWTYWISFLFTFPLALALFNISQQRRDHVYMLQSGMMAIGIQSAAEGVKLFNMAHVKARDVNKFQKTLNFVAINYDYIPTYGLMVCLVAIVFLFMTTYNPVSTNYGLNLYGVMPLAFLIMASTVLFDTLYPPEKFPPGNTDKEMTNSNTASHYSKNVLETLARTLVTVAVLTDLSNHVSAQGDADKLFQDHGSNLHDALMGMQNLFFLGNHTTM